MFEKDLSLSLLSICHYMFQENTEIHMDSPPMDIIHYVIPPTFFFVKL